MEALLSTPGANTRTRHNYEVNHCITKTASLTACNETDWKKHVNRLTSRAPDLVNRTLTDFGWLLSFHVSTCIHSSCLVYFSSPLLYKLANIIHSKMSGRVAIPPSTVHGSPTQASIELLSRRLLAAEEDTQTLMDQLQQLHTRDADTLNMKSVPRTGAPNEAYSDSAIPNRQTMAEAKSSFTSPPKQSSGAMKTNFDAVVARVCKTESALQTLKLRLMTVQSELDLSRKDKSTVTPHMVALQQAYEKQVLLRIMSVYPYSH